MEGAILLLHTKERRAIRCIQRLINTSHNFVFEDLDDIVEDAVWNGDILVRLRNVFYNWYLDQREVVVAKPTLLFIGPRKSSLIEDEDVLQEFQFLRP